MQSQPCGVVFSPSVGREAHATGGSAPSHASAGAGVCTSETGNGCGPGSAAAAPLRSANFFRGFCWAVVFELLGFAVLLLVLLWGPAVLEVLS